MNLPILPPISSIPETPEIFRLGLDIVRRHTAQHFVCFGTALGLHRDGDFIPDDTDLDIGIVNPSQELVRALMTDFEEHFRPFRILEHEGRMMQTAYEHPSGLIFDLSYYYQDSEFLSTYHDGKLYSDKPEHLEAVYRDTKYGSLPFPNPIEDYLEAHYGNWRIKEDNKSNYETSFHSSSNGLAP